MSTRNGSYARIVDAQDKQSNKTDKAPTKAPEKSPESARPSFGGKTSPLAPRSSNQNDMDSSPKPQPALQPRGFGAKGANWQAHNARRSKLQNKIKRSEQKARKANLANKQINPKLAAKAQKAVRTMRTASHDFPKDKGLGR